MTGGSGAGGIAKAIATEEAASEEEHVPASTVDKTAELQLRLDSIETQNEAIQEEREVLVSAVKGIDRTQPVDKCRVVFRVCIC